MIFHIKNIFTQKNLDDNKKNCNDMWYLWKRGRPKGYTPYINIKYEDLADWVGVVKQKYLFLGNG